MPEANPIGVLERETGPSVCYVDSDRLFSGALEMLCDLRGEILVLHGRHHSRAVALRLCDAYRIDAAHRVLPVAGALDEEVARLSLDAAMCDASTILAVGGGSVQDVAKLVAKRLGKQLLVLPTLVATDGVASPVAVVRDRQGRSTSRGAKAPDLVILCQALLDGAPRRYWQALVGDVVGNLVAVRDFRRFGAGATDAPASSVIERSCRIAEQAALRIVEFDAPTFESAAFRRLLVECSIESSRAMICAGTSHPCSGAEHLLSHAIDSVYPNSPWLHGIQVGAAVPFCLALHQETQLRAAVARLYDHLAIPTSLLDLGDALDTGLDRVASIAPSMRPGRRSVLDLFSTQELEGRLRSG